MTIFYGDQQNLCTNAALHQAATNLEAFQQQGFTFTRSLRDIFGQQMPNDAGGLQTLLTFGSDEADLTNVLSMLIRAIQATFQRQLSRYLPGGELSKPSEDLINQAASAPPTT
ncbi:hypothetical protein PoB_004937000 [Plakobranchus ocellatus]|uniref:Uncharacterized protein n=1 Tax=Plakobranchus ocellatus TaxID=259542 RepID=A0AAV4BU88_9GAST|nr:hypothetical protein PoB_004937000 [Plakobranchus ocellatus]